MLQSTGVSSRVNDEVKNWSFSSTSLPPPPLSSSSRPSFPGVFLYISCIAVCAAPKCMAFEPFWSEIRYRFETFWSECLKKGMDKLQRPVWILSNQVS